MKIVYSDAKSGRTAQSEVPKESEPMLMGRKMGETLEGALFGLEGYKLRITGLSDKTGAPSRKEVEFSRKISILLGGGPGIRRPKKGVRVRRLIRGNAIGADTAQINTVITEYGSKSADEIFPKKAKPEEKAEGAEKA